uniref:Uncharacterized protein n=1 Tax=candidate division WWE3 bacterium TaxID=2053526 RepID=A0A831Z173_UNCKA
MAEPDVYEEARRQLLLVYDILSGCHTMVERSRAVEEGSEVFNSGLSRVSSRMRMAMENLAEALGILEMWERERTESDDLAGSEDSAS